MATTGPGTAHTHPLTETPHPADALTASDVTALRLLIAGGTGTVTPPPTPTPPPAATPPGPPASLTATPGDTVVDLAWTAPASDGGSAITGYRVRRGAIIATTGVVLSYHDTGLVNNTRYGYTLAALNAIGEGTQIAEAATPGGLPSPGVFPPNTILRAVALAAVPSLPAKYGLIADPTFGTWIVRVGDAGQRHAYSKTQPWNSDGSLLHFAYTGRLLSGQTYALVSTALGNPGNFNWDPANPRLGYSTQGGETNLYRHDLTNLASPARTTLHNFARAISLGNGEGSISDNGTVALIDGSGNVATWNVQTNTGSAFWSTGGVPDSVTMSRDGTIVVAVFEPASTGHVDEIWAYNLDGTNAHRVRSGARHGDTAVSTSGRQVWVQAGGQMHDLLTGAMTQVLPAGNASDSGHVSGRGLAGWAYFSVYDTSAQSGKPGNDQVWAAKLDGSLTVEVFGFANRRGTSYETQPQAVPSRDGTRILFASDWGNSGTYAFVAGMNP